MSDRRAGKFEAKFFHKVSFSVGFMWVTCVLLFGIYRSTSEQNIQITASLLVSISRLRETVSNLASVLSAVYTLQGQYHGLRVQTLFLMNIHNVDKQSAPLEDQTDMGCGRFSSLTLGIHWCYNLGRILYSSDFLLFLAGFQRYSRPDLLIFAVRSFGFRLEKLVW